MTSRRLQGRIEYAAIVQEKKFPSPSTNSEVEPMGSVIKKRRKRMAKKKHRKMLRRTRVQRRKLGK